MMLLLHILYNAPVNSSSANPHPHPPPPFFFVFTPGHLTYICPHPQEFAKKGGWAQLELTGA